MNGTEADAEIEQIITIKIVRCSYCEISMQKPLNRKTIVEGLCRDPSRWVMARAGKNEHPLEMKESPNGQQLAASL